MRNEQKRREAMRQMVATRVLDYFKTGEELEDRIARFKKNLPEEGETGDRKWESSRVLLTNFRVLENEVSQPDVDRYSQEVAFLQSKYGDKNKTIADQVKALADLFIQYTRDYRHAEREYAGTHK